MTSGAMTWVLVAGEYPPQRGGVADYTFLLARSLAGQGDRVCIIAPPAASGESGPTIEGVTVHRLPDNFGVRGRRLMRSILASVAKPRALVLQYVPQSFGLRGCNIPFALWLRRASGYPLFTMFHEVSITVTDETPFKYRLQAIATRMMARSVIAASDAIFVSTPGWESLIRELGLPRVAIDWTPVCSNISLASDPTAVKGIRSSFAPGSDQRLLGHFGTYREGFSRNQLARVIPALLGDQCAVLFMGRGSKQFAQDLILRNPNLRDRIFGSGGLPSQALADHLAACDVLIQPFEDGVTARRGSVTAALALGIPVVTTSGAGTEEMWSTTGAVGLAPAGDDAALVRVATELASDGEQRADFSRRARKLYVDRFAIEHTASALRRRAMTATTAARP
jgi:glycosyltransferase involved in cell wall biosynthesis